METLRQVFGAGKDIGALQMAARAIVIFVAAFLLIRVAGRRSFGMRTPLDNIISILLGAILSRVVVGASAFLPVMLACIVIVGLHRFCGHLISRSKLFGKFFEGEKILLFDNGEFLDANMKRALVCKEDILQWVRKTAFTEDLNKIEKVYMEKNGEISAVKR